MMPQINCRRLPVLLVAAMSVAGCSRAPSADAAATVNGEAIARGDLALEARSSGTGADNDVVQQELLTQVVNRKLLAQEAIAQKADATPEFKVAERKARETALAEALMLKLVGDKARPTTAAIRAFIAENPTMFGGREVLTLDQIQTEAAAVDAAWLRSANTLAETATILEAHHVPFQRGRATADSAAMPPQLVKLLAEHPNEPFALPQGDKLLISQVTGRQRAAVPLDQVDALASAEIRRRAFQQAAATTLTNLRAKAKITYGQGFTAPADGPGQR